MRATKASIRVLLLLLALSLGFGTSARACPNCREALGNQTGEAAKLKDGYFYSIIFMMGMPFILLGTGTLFIVRAVKKGALPPL